MRKFHLTILCNIRLKSTIESVRTIVKIALERIMDNEYSQFHIFGLHDKKYYSLLYYYLFMTLLNFTGTYLFKSVKIPVLLNNPGNLYLCVKQNSYYKQFYLKKITESSITFEIDL